MKTGNRTTYSLLVRSEETGRSFAETMVYAALTLSVAVSILQFAVSPMAALKMQTHGISRVSATPSIAVEDRKS